MCFLTAAVVRAGSIEVNRVLIGVRSSTTAALGTARNIDEQEVTVETFFVHVCTERAGVENVKYETFLSRITARRDSVRPVTYSSQKADIYVPYLQ